MRKPKVTVVVAVYNEKDNIGRYLRSIENQTYPNIEIVVVDDGSKDNTVAIAKTFKVKVYSRSHAERSVQRNFGVKKASGKYVLVLDADMELTPKVVESCVERVGKHKALIVPERTVGTGFMATIRKFEREMYMGDPMVEVARFIDKKVFEEFGGYDEKLTGTEDYDLPYRISKKYSIGWAKEYILHHEAQLTLFGQLKKKYYYASKSATYADKHPELVKVQGTMLFRRAYARNWRKFVRKPFVGIAFIVVKLMETSVAVLGYVSTVGIKKFVRVLFSMFKK